METMKRINKQLIAFLMSLIFLLEPAVTTFAATEKNETQSAKKEAQAQTVSDASAAAGKQEDIPIETTDVPVNVIRVNAVAPSAGGNFIDPYAGERIQYEGKSSDESHEIVLVLDVSGSMDGKRIAELKEACLNFVSDILSEDPDAGISIVTFASGVNVYDFSGRYFTNDLIALKNTISGIRSGGGTAMNAGLVKADELLFKYGSADKKFIIQMADGEPNTGESYNGPDKKFPNGYESQVYNTYTAITGTAEYYIMSLGFFHSMSDSEKKQPREFMQSVQNSGYIEVGSGDELRFSFENISSFISTRPMLLNKSSLLLCPTLSEQLSVRFTSAYTATDKTVTWTSSDPAIAKAGADGLITGVSVGTCTVTASAGGNTVSCQVTVGNEPEKFFPKKSVTVYQNQNDPGADAEDFVLAEDAVITYCNKEYHTSKNGVASVPLAATGDISIEKEGYRKRIVSAGDLKNGNYTVYLEKESDNPIIYSVWNDNVDLLDSEIQIGLADKTKRKFSADVDWGKNQYGAIVLAQETKTVPFTQNVLETVLSENFDVSDDIYIIAKDSAGHSSKKKLQISMENDFMNGAKFDFGSKTTVKIPSNVPFIGGNDVTFDLKTLEKLPLSVEVEKRKVKVVIGVDLGSYEKKKTTKNYRKRGKTYSPKAETSNLCKDVKEIYKTFIQHPGETAQNCGKEVKGAFKKLKNIKSIYKNQMAKPKTKFGFEAECSVMGYIEAYIGDDGLHFLEGGIMVVPEVSAKWSGQFFVPIPIVNFIPFFWEAGLKAELEVLVNLARAAGSAENFTCMLSVNFKITGNGGLGVGVSGVIGLSGGVKLKINTKFKTYMKGDPYMSLNIDVNGYVKFEFLFLSYEWESDPWHLVDVNNGVADHPESIKTQTEAMDPEKGMLDIENYEPMDLSYLEQEEELSAQTGGLGIEQIFKANSFTGATPKLVSFEDGTKLAVWKDNYGTDYNNIQLYYSYFDGSTWSNAALLDGDNTLDGTFEVAASGNRAYVVWQNLESQIPAGIKIKEKEEYAAILKDTGIKAAVFDTRTESFSVSTITAPDEMQDMMPVVCADGDTADLVWVKNADNAAFGESGNNTIYTAALNADVWGQQTAVEEDCDMILELSAGRVGDQLYYATLRELDGDPGTTKDRAILINQKKVVSDQEALGRISFVNGSFYWYQNESIVSSKELSDPAKTSYESVLPQEIRLLNDNYQVFDENGQLRVLVLVEEGNKNELYQFIKDEEHDSWSSALPVSTLGGSINSFSGAVDKDDLSVIVSYATLTDPEAEEITKSLYGQNNVVLISYEPHNKLNVTDCIYDPELIVPGAVLPMTAVVQNESDRSVGAVTLKLCDKASGMVVSEREIDQEILAGDVGEFDFNYLIKEEDLGHTFELQAVSGSKDFEQGAAAELEINYQNLALDQTGWGKYADDKTAAIQGMVVNDGYTDAGAVTVNLYKVDKSTTDPSGEGLGAEMELVESKDLGAISAMDAKPLCFDVPYVEEAVYMLEISSDLEDLNLGDDTEYIYLTQRDQKLDRRLQSLTIKAPRTYFAVGEKIDLSTLRVEANYSDGLTADITAAATINTLAVKPDQIGAYNVTAAYGGKTASLTIEVLSQSDYQKRKEEEQAKASNGQKDGGQSGGTDTGKDEKTPQKGEVIKDKSGSYKVNDISDASGGTSNAEGISGTVTYMGAAGAVGGKTKVKTVTVPSYIFLNQKKYKVNEIADSAFANNKQITRIVIPKTIERIGKKAFFGCKNLKTIVFKTTKLKKGSIGKQAFKKAGSKNYKKLTVTIPKSRKKQYPSLLRKAGLYRKAKLKYKK
ncbi:MAG: VWA domain-containing protein [Lachnospiraceae bacterium]|nr:VWA domain-containing protein [Lachnospiraceae bacterium]